MILYIYIYITYAQDSDKVAGADNTDEIHSGRVLHQPDRTTMQKEIIDTLILIILTIDDYILCRNYLSIYFYLSICLSIILLIYYLPLSLSLSRYIYI